MGYALANSVEEGNENPVTSNAVYEALDEIGQSAVQTDSSTGYCELTNGLKMAWGRVQGPTAAITFPITFSGIPNVVVNPHTDMTIGTTYSNLALGTANNVTRTGCNVYGVTLLFTNGTPSVTNFSGFLYWQAIGK